MRKNLFVTTLEIRQLLGDFVPQTPSFCPIPNLLPLPSKHNRTLLSVAMSHAD